MDARTIGAGLLAILTTASLTNTIVTGTIFAAWRQRLIDYRTRPAQPEWRRMIAFIPLCQYCCSHYVGVVTCLILGVPWPGWVPVIWCAQHAMAASAILGQKHELMRASITVTTLTAQSLGHRRAAPPPEGTARGHV